MHSDEIKEIEGYFKEFDKCTIGYGVAVRIVKKVPALLAALKEKDLRIQRLKEIVKEVRDACTPLSEEEFDRFDKLFYEALSADEESQK